VSCLLQSELPGGVWHNDTSSSENDTSLASTTSSQPPAGDDDGGSVIAQSTSVTDLSTNSIRAGGVHKVSVPVARTVPSRTTALNTYSSLRKVEEEKKKHVRRVVYKRSNLN